MRLPITVNRLATSSTRVRKALDRLAYISLALDICIAAITTLGLLDVGGARPLLVPINYLLTIVVVLSVIMFVVLILLRSKEKLAAKTAVGLEGSSPEQPTRDRRSTSQRL